MRVLQWMRRWRWHRSAAFVCGFGATGVLSHLLHVRRHDNIQDRKRGDGTTRSLKDFEESVGASKQPGIDDYLSPNAGLEWFSDVKNYLASIQWSSLGDDITIFVVPTWARQLPGYFQKLQVELSMSPGSLADEIWREAQNPQINPEIDHEAIVRVSEHLCSEEQAFLKARRERARLALAKYLDVPEDEVDVADVPVIAMCGSGGGLRALISGAGSYLSTQRAGLFDCVTYTAGVSGSCWLQTLYNSSLSKSDFGNIIRHVKNRIGVHIAFPPSALSLITSAPTNKLLLSGFIEKFRSDPDADFGLVDVYGLLLAARLLVPKGELGVDSRDFKLTGQRAFIDQGKNPLPIYTAVRHEIPSDAHERRAWFQWFEMTPYEFWCEEYSAGIPTWSVGRHFESGHSVLPPAASFQPPEMRVPLLMGIWGSAFCATLYHYYKEIRPMVRGLTGLSRLDQRILQKNQDLIKVHPIDPASIPNFVAGMEDKLPGCTPTSIFKTKYIQLMDAGMSNNLPIYPLLRPQREVDVVIAFDSSADVKTDNWLHGIEDYARQRGIKGWPIGAGWSPRDLETDSNNASSNLSPDLGFCTIWVGAREECRTSEESLAKPLTESNSALKEPNAGIAVIYFPLLANPKVPGVDPERSDFMSTWNFVYTPTEVDNIVDLAQANWKEGEDRVKECIRAVWERKRHARWKYERRAKFDDFKRNLIKEGNQFL